MALTEAQKRIAEKNRKYWAGREAEALNHYVTDEKEYKRRLDGIYADMLDSAQKEINAFYGKYASKEGITLAEAKKRVSELDIKAYERKAKKYVAEKNFSKQANEEMRLYNLTMKVNRLELLKANIGLELISDHDELEKFMESILQGRTMDELKRQAGILGETITNNGKAAKEIVNASFHNAKFSDRIWMHQDLLRSDLNKVLQQGLIRGKGARELAKDIKKRFDVKKSDAERLVITELARVQVGAQMESYKKNGFKKYEFITNPDCCPICRALDGKIFDVSKMMPGENAPPMHPYCRCSTAPFEDSEDYEAWIDSDSGKGWKDYKNSDIINYAKLLDSMYLISENGKETFSKQEIVDELRTSKIGCKVEEWIESSEARIAICEDDFGNGNRGNQQGNVINIFPQNINSVRVAAQTLIHEMGHYHYNIGNCQYAEAICFGLEKLHLTGKEKLTREEWEYVKKLAIDNYPEFEWRDGGYGDFEKIHIIVE